jgi:DNA-binding CsgD family transcriptional regulator
LASGYSGAQNEIERAAVVFQSVTRLEACGASTCATLLRVDGVLCPVVVGRSAELSALAGLVTEASGRRGGLAVLVGEAGVGKSRLAREVGALAADRGFLVLSGRAVPEGSPLPFRPLAEALLVASRGQRPPDEPELAPFRAQLARLVPDWGTPTAAGGADDSPVLVGEAVVRLLRVLGGAAGALLILEDLHWADPETLAVLDYLADTLDTERVLCLATARPLRPSNTADFLDRLCSRRIGTVLPLDPLPAPQCAQMVRACLPDADVDDAVLAFVAEHSDGLPFLVEELLAGLVSSGALVRKDGRWRAAQQATPSIPSSFAESVRSRLHALDRDAQQVLAAAAVLGRRFDWDLLPGAAAVNGGAVVESLRRAVDAQLVTVDGQRFRFRHALTREAVLAELLPPERSALSARALVVVRRAHPGLPGPWCELAAELAEAAGDRDSAAALATDGARRALARGALVSAELTAERARRLAPAGSAVAADAEEVLVQALAHAGKPGPARSIGYGLLGRLAKLGAPAARRVELLLVLVRAALAAGDTRAAAVDVERAQELDDPGDAARAALDAVGAHIALAQGRLDDARRLALAAVAGATDTGHPDVECEALEVLGRLAASVPDSVAMFGRAADLAERHGLTTWRLRALQELVLTEAEPGEDRVLEVRRVAAHAGAHITVAQMDLVLADMALNTLDHDACLDAAQRCVNASRRYGLASLPVALLWLAGAHALGGRGTEMEAALAEAAAAAPGDPRVEADAWGRVRSTYLALREDRAALRHALDRSMELTRVAPETESVYPGQMWWALLHALSDDDLGVPARAEVARSRMVRAGFGDAGLALIDAVVLGRQGRADEAVAAVQAARTALGGRQWSWYTLRLVAEAAVRDRWGEPAAWLRETEAFFAGRAYHRVARECRALLIAAGAPAIRRGRGRSSVPPALRRLGITSRELDVLALVADDLPTREIAARLFLSPRTVEHHVASLLARTGARSRAELAAFAHANRVPASP